MSELFTTEPKMVLWDFLHQRTGTPWSTHFRGLGRVVDGELVGVVGYDNFTGSSCQMHFAGAHRRWGSRALIRRAFEIPFVDLGYPVVIGVVDSSNQESLDIATRLGFREVASIAGAYPSGSMCILEMRRENCRWIQGGSR